MVQRIINSAYHESIGTCPTRLLFGDAITSNRGLILPFADPDEMVVEDYVQRLNEVEKSLVTTSQAHQRAIITKYLSTAPPNPMRFQVSDKVLVSYPVRPPSKLASLWKGLLVTLFMKSKALFL